MYRPDVGLLTSEPAKHDVELNPHIIAPDPFTSDDCLDVFSPDHLLLLTPIEDENTMNTGEDEPSSGLNGRLRPRKSTIPSPQTTKILRKTENKYAQDKPKRTSTPSKASSTKADDLANKSELSPVLQLLCPYCDKKFASKQAISKHVRRIHLSSPKQDSVIGCLFCNHATDTNDIIQHMVDSHPNQYFACLDCHSRFASTSEFAEHKLNVCEKQKMSYRSKLRQKVSSAIKKKSLKINDKDFRSDNKEYSDAHRFNGIVISCELKPSQVTDDADIEDNITTNLILPPSKNLGTNAVIEKNAVIVLDDIHWNKRMPTNFSFHNTDADQILSRLGVVHRSPRTESSKKDWLKNIEDTAQKFEKCFDTSFYSKVASNVQENLSKFLDGSFNFNPDADTTIKTRKLKNSVVINTAEGFPILLACEQYSRNVFDSYLPRTIAPKHKWKWENDRNPINLDDIKRDSHVNNCIITLVSSLDIWTQLRMRRKFEEKFNIAPLEKKTEKQNTVSLELKEILESREIPTTSSTIVKYSNNVLPPRDISEFPASLGLRPSVKSQDIPPAVLSGEWVRPRCFVCCACGAQTRDSRGLSSHISTQHPNAHVQHYEIVGELLLNADILKHLYVPPSQSSNRTRPLRGIRECTKCKKPISLEDLHQHMLDCAGDTPTVRRKCRYRPFGVRRRRPRLPDNTIRKKIRKDIRRHTRQTRQKNHLRQRPKIRSEVGDAETIRKMLADLPAKRHRVMVTPVNSGLRPRKKIDKQRNKLVMKRRPAEISTSRQNRESSRNRNKIGLSGIPSEENVGKSSTASNNDDDDDKPLKTRVKRVLSNSARQKDSLKRKVVLKRAKRRAHLKEQTVVSDTTPESTVEEPTASSSGHVEQLSIGNMPQRIDMNNSPYNTREHSNRNRSNNNNYNEQRSGFGSQNGNVNDSFVPVQNHVPLKHSIARLTANTDTHDKSLQYRHLYLLQQSFSSSIHHGLVEQRPMFENEAIVTKLDKPPLHFQPRGMLDPFAFQKNKPNKPRKGLNDCIAMLKNKLVEPFPAVKTAQSVGSASDEPLICESATTERRSSNTEYAPDVNSKPAEVFSRHRYIHNSLFEIQTQNKEIQEKIADLPLTVLPEPKPQKVPSPEKIIEKPIILPEQQPQQKRIEVSSRKGTEIDIYRKKIELPPHIEIIPQKSTESYPINVSLPPTTHVLSQIVISNTSADAHEYKVYKPTSQTILPDIQIHDQSTHNQITSGNPPDARVPVETQINDNKQSSCYMNSQPPKPKVCNKYAEKDYNKPTPNTLPDREVSTVIQQHEIHSENVYNKPGTSAQPPAIVLRNSNTPNIEPILTTPLDLSVNLSDSSELSSKQNSSYDISEYESYETLDLSNKSSDHLRDDIMMEDINDGVVDLRVKSTLQNNNSLQKDEIESATDLSIRTFEASNLPTDLSIRKKSINDAYVFESVDLNYDCVQDLSRHKNIITDTPNRILPVDEIDQETPTDLSGKSISNIPRRSTSFNTPDTRNRSATVIDEPRVAKSIDLTVKVDSKNKTEMQNATNRSEIDGSLIGLEKCQGDYVNNLQNYEYRENVLQPLTVKDSYQCQRLNFKSSPDQVHDKNSQLKEVVTSFAADGVESIQSSMSDNITAAVNSTIATCTKLIHLRYTEAEIPAASSPNSTISGSIPLYTLSNPLPISKTKYESTTPVYTLANACISMTKIEPSISSKLNELKASDSNITATESSVPVYTLTDTTVKSTQNRLLPVFSESSKNAKSLIDNMGDVLTGSNSCTSLSVYTPKSVDSLVSSKDMNTNISTDIKKHQMNIPLRNSDVDPETAKKIAMLPKELVEILGTMPVDHRNQLLNVLPHYVSKSPSAESKEISEIPVNTHTLVDTPLRPSLVSTHTATSEHDTKPVVNLQNLSDIEDFHGNKYSHNICKTPSLVSEMDQSRIIDLTDDDTPTETNITKAPEEFTSSVTIQIEPPTTKSNKMKVKDQTASLRAVRIKAPSERNKSLCLENQQLIKSSTEQPSTLNIIVENKQNITNDINDFNKTLAIQQAEVSSTQHNTTGSSGSKYPLAISPTSTESSSDESVKNTSQKIPVIVSDITKKPEEIYKLPLPKSTVVSSSISTNERNSFDVEHVQNKSEIHSHKLSNTSPAEKGTCLKLNKELHFVQNDEPNEILTKSPLKQAVDVISHDDSEDDISLATIVKQKQRDQIRNENIQSNIQIPDVNKKKKKDKKYRKSNRKSIAIQPTGDVSTSESTRSLPFVSNNPVSLVECKDETATFDQNALPKVDDIHSKKKIKKGTCREISNREKTKDDNDQAQESEITHDFDEVTKNESINEISSQSLKATTMVPVNVDLKTNKLDEGVSDCKLDDIKIMSKIKNFGITDKDESDTVHIIDTSSVTTSDQNINSVPNLTALKVQPVSTDVLNIKVNNKLEETDDRDPENNSYSFKKEKKCVRSKNVTIPDDVSHQDSYLSKEFEVSDHITTPLRRSRRGKSLFIESTSIEKDIMNCTEISLESKTPLTKKQLIFSKLLLDEGKPILPAHSTPEKQDMSDITISANTSSISHTEVSAISETESISTCSKSKGTKRRIPPHGNKKAKKKKSIEVYQNSSNVVVNEDVNRCTDIDVDSTPNITDKLVKKDNASIKNEKAICDAVDVEMDLTPNVNDNKNKDMNQTSAEKRKLYSQKSLEFDHNSKPKKSKIYSDSNNTGESKESFDKDLKSADVSGGQTTETRTACYNLPVAAKRGRSKSVVVKSSASDLYDPYDIDLEDMIESNETFRRKDKSADGYKRGKVNSGPVKQNSKVFKEKEKTNIACTASRENVDSAKKPALSDSDESSKSDVPLQKYVHDKEKKYLETENYISIDKNTPLKVNDSQKKSNQSHKKNHDSRKKTNESQKKNTESDVKKSAENEAELELRSEQFMESFGFFCERKPRKSNLLATKKISETFHITNESDDMYFGFKQKSSKKSLPNESKKSVESENSKVEPQPSTSKKIVKRGRKKKGSVKPLPSYCNVCKKEFRRSDNYLRHQMTLLHISKLSEVEMKVKTTPVHEEPNYLIAYKQYIERFKKLTDRLAKLKKRNPKAAAKIGLPSIKDILSDVNRTVREQQLSQRGLSRDEELFIDCCELLKESHSGVADTSDGTSSMSGLDLLEQAINEHFLSEYDSDDDVDSITAQNILESEEVRNLENDLISGLKEAANASRKASNMNYHKSLEKMAAEPSTSDDLNDSFSSPTATDSHYHDMEEFDMPEKIKSTKSKKHTVSTEIIQIKEKMYPDIIEDIDMFEDKFDKIKRKCRSQAAAAKQPQPVIDQSVASHKARRKAEKKKGKKNSKKTRHQSTQVPTKGALKGFDGIKVSIPTSDINLSALVPVPECPPRKKKKTSSKKKRDKKDSESSSKYDSDHRIKEGSGSHNQKLDVYEFMDNEDAELFEFRPSTLMERFKSISSKDLPSTSKASEVVDDNSSESGSDGDDFVYMSDDYVCSDDETENSLLSCENGNVKVGHEMKKNVSPQKRKDAVEKIAVMGKIFKHNAVRTEKKQPIPKEQTKPKANLDQLFDSLLEEEPSTSMLNDETASPKDDEKSLAGKRSSTKTSEDKSDDNFTHPQSSLSPSKSDKNSTLKRRRSSSKDYACPQTHENISKKYNIPEIDYGPSTSKKYDSVMTATYIDYGPSTSKKYDSLLPKERKDLLPKKNDTICNKKNQEISSELYEQLDKHSDSSESKLDDSYKSFDNTKSPERKVDEGIGTSYDYGVDACDQEDEAGVARQRARRKCTVGKQNILAESWSSESEPDGGPPRPNSAESDIAGAGRKKKGKKKDSQQAGGRRGNNRLLTLKKIENESRVNSNNRNSSGSGSVSGYYGGVEDPGEGTSAGPSVMQASSSAAAAAAEAAAAMPAPAAAPGAPGAAAKGRPRSVAYYWNSEGDDEQEHQQQHGWIVGDSHKKLVTMLAHAKGRKRNNDEKRHLIE